MNDIVPFLIRQAEEIATEGHNGWGNTMIMAAEEIERLRARNQRLEEVLRFYADEETHEGGPTGPAPIDLDLGDRARDALESDMFMEEA